MKKKEQTQREINALITRKKIFKTAVQLFAKHGFNNVTVEDITKSAKVSKGTFYTHFTSKDNVLVEQFKLIDEQYEKAYLKIDKNAATIDQIKESIIEPMCEYVQNTCGVSVIQVVYMNQISPAKKTIILNNQNRALYRIIGDIIQRGIDRNEIRADIGADTLTKYFTRELRGLIYDWCMSNGSFDLKVEGEKYSDYMCERFFKKD